MDKPSQDKHRYVDSAAFWKDQCSRLHDEKDKLQAERDELEQEVDRLKQQINTLNPSQAEEIPKSTDAAGISAILSGSRKRKAEIDIQRYAFDMEAAPFQGPCSLSPLLALVIHSADFIQICHCSNAEHHSTAMSVHKM